MSIALPSQAHALYCDGVQGRSAGPGVHDEVHSVLYLKTGDFNQCRQMGLGACLKGARYYAHNNRRRGSRVSNRTATSVVTPFSFAWANTAGSVSATPRSSSPYTAFHYIFLIFLAVRSGELGLESFAPYTRFPFHSKLRALHFLSQASLRFFRQLCLCRTIRCKCFPEGFNMCRCCPTTATYQVSPCFNESGNMTCHL